MSLLDNNREEQIQIHLITDQTTTPMCDQIRKVVEENEQLIEIIAMENYFGDVEIQTDGRHPKTIYAKLFAGSFFEMDRILYLDSDTVIVGNIHELYYGKMDECIIAGVLMPYSAKQKEKIGIIKDAPHICDGVVLIDLVKWRAQDKELECKEFIDKHKGVPPMMSEGTINYVCSGAIKALAPQYDVMSHMLHFKPKQIIELYKPSLYYSEEEIRKAAKEPIVIHFLAELYARPWNVGAKHPYQAYYKKYEKMVGIKRRKGNIEIGKTLIVHLLYYILPFCIFCKMYHLKHQGTV